MAQIRMSLLSTFALVPALLSCTHDSGNKVDAGPLTDAVYNSVPRDDFNRIAADLALPIFWTQDANDNGALDVLEVSSYWGLASPSQNPWTEGGHFTKDFASQYDAILSAFKSGVASPGADDAKRHALVLEELHQGRQTIVQTDLSKAADEDKQIVRHIFDAAVAVERIFDAQNGVQSLGAKIPADDTASRMLFFRNQGPWCRAPKTEKNPDCNALPGHPKQISGLYPTSLQEKDKDFCTTLAARKDADTLLSPFVVVREDKAGQLSTVPYSEAFKDDMTSVSKSLKEAADAIKSPSEQAFKTYLLAASQAFLDNNWQPADEAWSKMNTQNSKWYLRIGPDETYNDPCSRKAGFHVSFALINDASLAWQKKLDPLKTDMEAAYAAVAGAPYKAHPVSFHLPDFINIVLNAGDSRPPHGATIGQSLPNWGPVANEGRGRTVAMTNFYKDADSKKDAKIQAASLFCPATMERYANDDDAGLLDTLLHEASHNLGPSHEYRVRGKTDEQIFGGPMASMLEELKAETGSFFFSEWLLEKKQVSKELVDQMHLSYMTWAFGHIASGMYDAQGKSKPYSQVAAIQLGFLLKDQAVHWNPSETAANKQDKGCFEVDLNHYKSTSTKLAKLTVGLKARGDKALAEKLKAEYVDSKAAKNLQSTIAERWLRAPKASFIYSVKI